MFHRIQCTSASETVEMHPTMQPQTYPQRPASLSLGGNWSGLALWLWLGLDMYSAAATEQHGLIRLPTRGSRDRHPQCTHLMIHNSIYNDISFCTNLSSTLYSHTSITLLSHYLTCPPQLLFRDRRWQQCGRRRRHNDNGRSQRPRTSYSPEVNK